MSGHPQGHYDDGYGHHGQGNDMYYQEDYHDQYDYGNQMHNGDGHYDEA